MIGVKLIQIFNLFIYFDWTCFLANVSWSRSSWPKIVSYSLKNKLYKPAIKMPLWFVILISNTLIIPIVLIICKELHVLKINFNHEREIFKRFVRTWSSQIFLTANQSLPYGSYNKTSVYKSWSRNLVAANHITPFNCETKSLGKEMVCIVSIRNLFNPQKCSF